MSHSPHTRIALAAAACAALFVPAAAQEAYGPYGASPGYSTGYGQSAGTYYSPAPYDDTVTSVDEITVWGGRQVVGRSPTTGAPIERVTVSRVVSARDLDLRSEWGVDELVRRVQEAARSACRELDASYPIDLDQRPCYRDTVNRSMAQVDAAISAAHAYF